jgi:hypothetical protein
MYYNNGIGSHCSNNEQQCYERSYIHGAHKVKNTQEAVRTVRVLDKYSPQIKVDPRKERESCGNARFREQK